MSIDGLTGLPTHRELAAHLSVSAVPFAAFFDIDALVWLTHIFGYQASDAAIIRVAGMIRDRAAALGCPTFRIGGDEFLAVLDGRTHDQAVEFARSTLSLVSAARIEYRRADDPARNHLALNAVVCRVTRRIEVNPSQVAEWFADQIWKARGGDLRRCEVLADMGDDLPPWAT